MILNLSDSVDLKKAETYFAKLKEDEAKIELKKIHPKRSLSQNSYLHVCLSLYAIEYGDSLEATKQMLKWDFNWIKEDKQGRIIYESTADKSTEEIGSFIDYIRNRAVKDLGAYIPTPEEYKLRWHEYENEIQKHKQYL